MTEPADGARERHPQAHVSDTFLSRWSPRSFNTKRELIDQEIESVFEAARWAPSSFNDQPWLFLVAKRGDENFPGFLNLLDEENQVWAKNAALVGFIVCRMRYKKSGALNPCAEFDCGAAWFSMTMQARTMGLFTRGVEGFDRDKAYDWLGVNREKYKIISGFALGAIDNPEKLPNHLREHEHPSQRKPLTEVFQKGPLT